MSRLFEPAHRTLQDRHDTRAIADRIEAIALETSLSPASKAFIEARDMLFLATVDGQGRPTVSYKGGEPGFVRVLDEQTLAFPSYDGNGMFLSAGNAAAQGWAGLLFIDLETPNRLRVQGRATVSADDPLRNSWAEAELVVRVAVTEVWPNCPRYVHRYKKIGASRYVPKPRVATPMAEWKRVDILQDALPKRDQGRANTAGGTLTIEQWFGQVAQGDG